MRIELEKRAKASALFSILSPFIALALTILFGGVMFALLGKNPVTALYSFFVEPLSEVWSLHELAIKAAPLILIGVGLSVCFRSNNWNIGAEGQFIMGAIAGSALPVLFYDWQSPLLLPLMMLLGMIGGSAFCGHTGLSEGAYEYQRDPDKPDAGLCGSALSRLARSRPLAQSARHELSGNADVRC